jgi:hypothetical protein
LTAAVSEIFFRLTPCTLQANQLLLKLFGELTGVAWRRKAESVARERGRPRNLIQVMLAKEFAASFRLS